MPVPGIAYTNGYSKSHVVDGTRTNKAARGLVTDACTEVRARVVIAITKCLILSDRAAAAPAGRTKNTAFQAKDPLNVLNWGKLT